MLKGGGGHLGPAPQIERLLSNLELRDQSVVSGQMWKTDHCWRMDGTPAKGAPSLQSEASSWIVLAITPPAYVQLTVVLSDLPVCDQKVPSPDGGEVM